MSADGSKHFLDFTLPECVSAVVASVNRETEAYRFKNVENGHLLGAHSHRPH